MMNAYLLYLLLYLLSFPNITLGTHLNKVEVENGINIGAILDCRSRVGKEESVAMEMAVQDLDKRQKQKLILRLKCSLGRPVHAAQAARYLINRGHVKAILGPNSWEESLAMAEVSHQLHVPILSFYDSTPSWATKHWPFFIQASPTTANQMKAIVSIIQSWKWSKVNVIYEDSGRESSYVLNHLYGALKHGDVQVNQLLPLTSFASSNTLRDKLEKLNMGQTRVFIVHTNSLDLAQRIFRMAKEMKMMEMEYVWITTHPITSLVHSMNSSMISSMEGVLGVKRYLPHITEGFNDRFIARFERKYPEEKNHEPGIFALQAYDAMWALGLAVKEGQKIMLKSFEEMDVNRLSGKIKFTDRRLGDVAQFQIINVVGKSYRELGFWSERLGFSKAIDNTASYSSSMEILGPVIWPGGPLSTPRGWELPTISNPMRIGVPNGTLLNKFVKVECDTIKNKYKCTGFAFDVFREIGQKLNYSLAYDCFPFNGDYNDLVKKVHSKEFDAAVGDIVILSNRYDYVEFTHAYTEPGLVMVVPIQRQNQIAWLFLKPFTKAMWLLTVFITVYNGFVVWRIEIDHCPEMKELSFLSQMTNLIYMAFGTLFSLHGERMHSNLSKMATVVWLFVALIITQSYTASLASMLTLQNIEPKIANLETLKSQNANIGYTRRSFVKDYLVGPLQFNPNYVKNFTSAEAYADALRSGEISAAFLETPDAKLFVAKYCKTFTIAGPTYKVGGYGFAFQKGSSLLHDIDKALLSVSESGTLKGLEDEMLASEKCVDIQADNDTATASLSPHGFFMPFVMTGATSTTVLLIYYFRNIRKMDNSMAQHKLIWLLISLVLKKWRNQRNRFSRKVSDVAIETPQHTPNHRGNTQNIV